MRKLLNIWAGVLMATLLATYLVASLKGAAADAGAAPAVAGSQQVNDAADLEGGPDDGGEVDRLAPDAGNLRAFAELARTDLRLRKSLIIAQNLPLTDDEAA